MLLPRETVRSCIFKIMKYFNNLSNYLFIVPVCVIAISSGVIAAGNAITTNRVALVMGNSNYAHADFLPNPASDARAISQKLLHLGFDVVEGIDQSRSEMKALLRKFVAKLDDRSIALFYYAGHGIQYQSRNFLIPVDADINDVHEVEFSGIDLDMILIALKNHRPKLSIGLLDACRNNPFEKRIRDKVLTRSGVYRGSGLAAVNSVNGTILSYATEPGNVAIDGDEDHSPYTAALLKYLAQPGLSVQDMLNKVGLDVAAATNGDQNPWVSSSPIPEFCFAGCDVDSVASRAQMVSIDDSKINATIVLLTRAMEQRDLAAIKKLVLLSEEQETLLEGIFSTYSKLTFAALVPMKSDDLSASNVVLNIQEAINHNGNRVLPSLEWKHISLKLKKQIDSTIKPEG